MGVRASFKLSLGPKESELARGDVVNEQSDHYIIPSDLVQDF